MLTSTLPSSSADSSATALNASASVDFAAKLAESKALLQRISSDFSPITQASSLGAEDVVITHLINSLKLAIPVFVLETGVLNTQTLELLARTRVTSNAAIKVLYPVQTAVIEFTRLHGEDVMYKSIELRKACCGIRKMEPLSRALLGQRAWITGLRQGQSSARAQVALQDNSEVDTKNLSKFNPLAKWSWGDVWHYIATHNVDYNALHDQFFPSIGCAPCTRAISQGEDFRAGRWWWEDEAAKECGLHVKN